MEKIKRFLREFIVLKTGNNYIKRRNRNHLKTLIMMQINIENLDNVIKFIHLLTNQKIDSKNTHFNVVIVLKFFGII